MYIKCCIYIKANLNLSQNADQLFVLAFSWLLCRNYQQSYFYFIYTTFLRYHSEFLNCSFTLKIWNVRLKINKLTRILTFFRFFFRGNNVMQYFLMNFIYLFHILILFFLFFFVFFCRYNIWTRLLEYMYRSCLWHEAENDRGGFNSGRISRELVTFTQLYPSTLSESTCVAFHGLLLCVSVPENIWFVIIPFPVDGGISKS